MITLEQFKDIKSRILKLKECFKIDDLNIELEESQLRIQDPTLWNDPEQAQCQLKKVSDIQKTINTYKSIEDNFNDLRIACDLHYESEVDCIYPKLISLIESLEFKNLLKYPEDSMDCILQINSGAGGTEAQDWASMLLKMYIRWAEFHNYEVYITNFQEGDVAGIKTATIEILGKTYGYLKGENGVHRLVRVSPFNAQGKRMTSFASVFVTPLIDDSIKINIDQSKLKTEFFRCSGAGGQNVNKVETGVRLRYTISDGQEIIVENTETRRQHDNRENALRILKSKLYDIELRKKQEKRNKIESEKKKIEWGSQIRSYVFDDRRVKDHRTNYQTSDVDGVMNGEIDEFIKTYLLYND